MLHRALGEVLALGDARRLEAPLDQRATDAAQPEIDRERDAHRAAADDDDLISRVHPPSFACPADGSERARGRRRLQFQITATQSTSMSNGPGQDGTCRKMRAGASAGKNLT